MGRRTAVWKAALWGGVCGTLPDLDAFIDHGDAIANMTWHRAESHALFWLTLASPAIAAVVARLHGEMDRFRRWWLALWLALVTHPLLDVMTVYGTQLGLPFTNHPYGVGSIFIIDPLYTLPLLVGVVAALSMKTPARWSWNAAGLALSTLYLAWSVAAQQQARTAALASLHSQGIHAERVLVTPAPFSTLLWRIVAIDGDSYHEGFHSLLDDARPIEFDRFERGIGLYDDLRQLPRVQRLAWFSHGYFKLGEHDGTLRITDLRMGQEPFYTFTFVVAQRSNPSIQPVAPRLEPQRPELAPLLRWTWRRALGERLPPPRAPSGR